MELIITHYTEFRKFLNFLLTEKLSLDYNTLIGFTS